MSPFRFTPLPFQQAPAAGAAPARPASALPVSSPVADAGPRRRADPAGDARRGRAPGRLAAGRAAPAGRPFLAIAASVEPGAHQELADAVLARALQPGPVAGTVVLDLGSTAELDVAACAALCAVRDALAAAGARLLVVAASRQAREQIAAADPPHRLEAEEVHLSLRSAVLAAYAALPGPGVVTADIRDALARPAEPLPPPRAPSAVLLSGLPASPAEDGATPGRLLVD